MDERSKHYDWFNGSPHDKKSTKGRMKITWKFIKIFLYFSLFFFSMWGCVQTFTHKIQPGLSSGLTLANGDHNLSPKQTLLKIKNIGDNKNPKISLEAESIFESASKKDGSYIIKEVNDELKRFGIKRPTDARYGANYITSFANSKYFKIDFKKQEQNKKIFSKAERIFVPVVFSTALQKSKKNVDKLITKINLQPKLKLKVFGINTKEKTTKLNIYDDFYYDINKIIENSEKQKNSQDRLSFKFNGEAFKIFYNKYLFNGQTLKEFIENKRKIIENFSNEDLKEEQIKQVESYNQIVNFLVKQVLGINNKNNDGIYIISSNPIGYKADDTWKPITTWKDSWSSEGGYGPFFGIFVWPISYITNAVLNSMPMLAGWGSFITICLVVILVSLFMFFLNFKNTLAQTKMQELSSKKAIIDAKYAPYKGNKQMENRQRQEIAEMYKKEGVSPLSAIGTAFITMPFFIAMWRVIGTSDHIKGTTWIGIKFSATSWRQLFAHLSSWENGWVYFPLMLFAFLSNIFSQIFPRMLTKKRDGKRINVQQRLAMKKGNKIQNIMMFVFAFISLIFSAGLQVYFIIRSLWRIAETYVTHVILIKNRKRKIARAKGVL